MPEPKRKRLCPKCQGEIDNEMENCPGCKLDLKKSVALYELFKFGRQLSEPEVKDKPKEKNFLDDLLGE